jgi:hypothetical protein
MVKTLKGISLESLLFENTNGIHNALLRLHTVAHICNPGYLGNDDRRIIV